MKYLVFVAKLVMVAMLVALVTVVLGFYENQVDLRPFVAGFLLVAVIELASYSLLPRIAAMHTRLTRRLGRESASMACVLALWFALSVPAFVVLLSLWSVAPAAAPAIVGPGYAALMALFVVALKGGFAIWTGTPFRLLRFVCKRS